MENKLIVKIYDTRQQMGEAAADMAANKINELLFDKDEVNIIFAAAPSQNEFLASFIQKKVDWSKVNAFHMDEYVGLESDAPQGFGNFLKERVFDKVSFKTVNYLNGNATTIHDECKRYEILLNENPTDIVCMGIGENGHIAFNDPHVANFEDRKMVKVVDLDEACRQQQVNDGCFQSLVDVPAYALTLTVPALMKARHVFCIVPGEQKANAVYNTMYQPQTHFHPSTILRSHPDAILFLDKNSSNQLNK